MISPSSSSAGVSSEELMMVIGGTVVVRVPGPAGLSSSSSSLELSSSVLSTNGDGGTTVTFIWVLSVRMLSLLGDGCSDTLMVGFLTLLATEVERGRVSDTDSEDIELRSRVWPGVAALTSFARKLGAMVERGKEISNNVLVRIK